MTENEIAKIIVNAAYEIHKELGPGLFESVYETILEHKLKNEYGLSVSRQAALPVIWKNISLDLGFRPDLIVEERVIIEIKSIEALSLVHF